MRFIFIFVKKNCRQKFSQNDWFYLVFTPANFLRKPQLKRSFVVLPQNNIKVFWRKPQGKRGISPTTYTCTSKCYGKKFSNHGIVFYEQSMCMWSCLKSLLFRNCVFRNCCFHKLTVAIIVLTMHIKIYSVFLTFFFEFFL